MWTPRVDENPGLVLWPPPLTYPWTQYGGIPDQGMDSHSEWGSRVIQHFELVDVSLMGKNDGCGARTIDPISSGVAGSTTQADR